MKYLFRRLIAFDIGFLLFLFSSLAVIIPIIGALLHRLALIPGWLFLYSLFFCILLALLIFVVGIIYAGLHLGKPRSVSQRKALQAAFLALILIALPFYSYWINRTLPAINDITTDVTNPPEFRIAPTLRSSLANSTDYPGAETAREQTGFYIDIVPFFSDLSVDNLFEAALRAAQESHWTVLDYVTPSGPGTEGRIEASDYTPWLHFVDDIVIRIRRHGKGARLDIRSASRYGIHDFGTNAERIRRFLIRLRSSLRGNLSFVMPQGSRVPPSGIEMNKRSV